MSDNEKTHQQLLAEVTHLRKRIEELSEVTSPMPKQAENLSRQELRDLLAFLKQLDGRK